MIDLNHAHGKHGANATLYQGYPMAQHSGTSGARQKACLLMDGTAFIYRGFRKPPYPALGWLSDKCPGCSYPAFCCAFLREENPKHFLFAMDGKGQEAFAMPSTRITRPIARGMPERSGKADRTCKTHGRGTRPAARGIIWRGSG